MKTYDPADWFWIVGGDDAQVYGSAAGVFMPVAEPGYVAWLADGGITSRIGTAAELGEVLAAAKAPVPSAPDVLAAYQDAVAGTLTKAADAQLLLYTLNTARRAAGDPPIAADEFHAFVRDNVLK